MTIWRPSTGTSGRTGAIAAGRQFQRMYDARQARSYTPSYEDTAKRTRTRNPVMSSYVALGTIEETLEKENASLG